MSLLFCFAIQAQVSYSGNGNSGFGGPIGNASMTINDDGTTITFTFTKGGADFNDSMAMYISTGATGRSVIDTNVNDTADALRRAISNTGSGDITLPAGFAATHGVAINTGFGGLWSIPATGSIGANGLVFITAVGNPAATTTASFTFSFDWSDIGLTNKDKFDFVITYGNPNDGGTNMFSSDEAFGDGIGGGNPGTSAITFTGDKSYPNTWTGTTSNNWATATNWTEGVPSSTDNVYIPAVTNHPTATAAVTINKGIIKSGASLIAQSTFAGTMTYQRSLGKNNWYLVSAPVKNETIEDLIANNDIDNTTGTGANIGLAPYDNSQAVVTDRWDYQTAGSTGTLTSGGGYSVKFNNSGTLSFTGDINVENEGVAISDNTGGGGNAFNLVGNPYPSFLAANTNASATNNILKTNDTDNDFLTESTIWLWNQDTNSYDEVNLGTASKHIAPGQGFFVSSNGSNTFSVTEAMQSHQGTETFQKSTNSRTELQLILTDGTNTKDAGIFYIDGTTTSFDNGYDSSIFGGVDYKFSVYTEAVANGNGKKLGIQSLPNSDLETMVIPVGVKAEANKEITFSANVSNLPSGLKVFLEDRTTNTFTRLDELNSSYKVTFNEAVNGIGRFYLHTKSSALSTDAISLENVSIYKTNKSTLRIVGVSQGKSTFKLFNTLGKQVMNSTFNSNGVSEISLPKLATGVYIIQLENGAGKLKKGLVQETTFIDLKSASSLLLLVRLFVFLLFNRGPIISCQRTSNVYVGLCNYN